ncbi:MAG: alpha/beta hydrolase [Lachnospiraceae bacterium]|nr:alpha/beta hydrolase [Lachnospiraceae bacterium]
MEYSKITPEMKISDLVENDAYGIFRDYIFTYMTPDHYNCKLQNYGFEKVGFIEGLHRMEELAASDGHNGQTYLHDIYPVQNQHEQWDKAYAKYLHFPAKNTTGEPTPYVIVIPGGAFNRQWGFIEGQAIAAHLNNLGYTAFVLYYRVKQEPVVALAIEDMINAIRDIEAKANLYNIKPGEYMIGGFSAGATLAGEIGSDNYGWKNYNVPKPQAVFLGYTAVSMVDYYEMYASLDADDPMKEAVAPFLRRMAGPTVNQELINSFDLPSHIDSTYPKTYIVANEDDGTVPVSNSKNLNATLEDLGVEHITNIGKTGDHSFGLGNGLDVDGWLDEAVKFWQNK